MNLALTETQELLRLSAREFLAEKSPASVVKEMMRDPRGASDELWRGICDLGWTGLLVPEAYGGSGGTITDAVILFEEVGRFLPPAPLFTSAVLGALVLQHCGSEAQQAGLLPGVVSGQTVLSLAFTEPTATWQPSGVEATATKTATGWTLNGTKLFVHDAHLANPLIVVARVAAGDDGLRCFLVPAGTDGVALTPLTTISGDKQFEVVLRNVALPETAALPGGWPQLQRALRLATIVKCAEMVGGSQKALEMAVEYSKQRIAFGRPIGTFQAIQHKCANMVTNVDGLRMMVYEAAWKLDEGMDAAVDVALAKEFAGEVFRTTTTEAHQIFAGLAFSNEHDLHLYFRRVKPSDAMLGDSHEQRQLLGDLLAL